MCASCVDCQFYALKKKEKKKTSSNFLGVNKSVNVNARFCLCTLAKAFKKRKAFD